MLYDTHFFRNVTETPPPPPPQINQFKMFRKYFVLPGHLSLTVQTL